MTSVGVVAHADKRLGGGLAELRKTLAEYGITDPPWHEVRKSKGVPDRVDELIEQGVDLLFVWGGDGSVQRAIDAIAGKPVTLAILPAGTANLLATNLGLPDDL
jgi:diacylglycerol kinase (ATP)